MAYQLHYWKKDGTGIDNYVELKCVRLKSIHEAYPLSLWHHRPANCHMISVTRTDNLSPMERIIMRDSND